MAATLAAHTAGTPRRETRSPGGIKARSPRGTGRPSVLGLAAVSAVLIAFLVGVGCLPTLSEHRSPEAGVRTIRVRSADSLWSIAETNHVPGSTTAETVRTIQDMNHLSTSEVSAGSVIRVPSTETFDAALASR